MLSFLLFTVMSGEGKKPNLNGRKSRMTWKAKRKESLWRMRAQRSKEVLHLQTNYRRFPAKTWGPEHVWGSYSISDNIKYLSYNGQWMPPRCKANLLIYSNSPAGPESVNEAFCNHGDRSAPLWSLHRNEKQKMKRGEEKDTHQHSFLSPGERKHSHVMRESLPFLGGRTNVRRGGAPPRTHTHTLRAVLSHKDAAPTLTSCVSVKDDSEDRTGFPKITGGTQWISETSRARLKLWLTLLSEFRFCSRKHAREIKRFGLCGHDKRGPVVSRDVGLSVQNERLSEHRFSRGRGETWTRTHTFLCCLPVHVACSY